MALINYCCIKIFCICSFNDSISTQNLRSCGSISRKAVLIFPKNFFNFRLGTIEKQGKINLSSYSNKSYVPVILSDSKVSFLQEGQDAVVHPFLYCVLFIQCCIIKEVCHQTRLYFIKACYFSAFNFFRTASKFYSVKFLSLMSSWPLIISSVGLSVISEGFPSRFLKCFFHFWSLSSWLAAFNFATMVLFLFIVYHTNCDCLFFYKNSGFIHLT